jgi:hypothetical protein
MFNKGGKCLAPLPKCVIQNARGMEFNGEYSIRHISCDTNTDECPFYAEGD